MKKFLAMMLLLAMLFTACAKETPEATEPPQAAAPDFTVYDQDENPVKLSDFAGTPVVLNFWASWCGPCRMEMPEFEDAYQEYGDQVAFMMVNLTDGANETVETASALIQEHGYTFPVYFDITQAATILYGIRSIPTTFFIDGEGIVVGYATGSLDRETLQAGMDRILPE